MLLSSYLPITYQLLINYLSVIYPITSRRFRLYETQIFDCESNPYTTLGPRFSKIGSVLLRGARCQCTLSHGDLKMKTVLYFKACLHFHVQIYIWKSSCVTRAHDMHVRSRRRGEREARRVRETCGYGRIRLDTVGCGRIRSDTAGYGRIRSDTARYGCTRADTAGYGRIRTETAGYVRIRPDTVGYGRYG